MVEYKINDNIEPGELDKFFHGWKSPPSLKIKEKLLKGSDVIITARENGNLTGFLTAINDGVMHVFISLVEVLETHQGKGIGSHLMKRAVDYFKGYYDIVLITDKNKGTFYKKFGFNEIYGMHIRDFTYRLNPSPLEGEGKACPELVSGVEGNKFTKFEKEEKT